MHLSSVLRTPLETQKPHRRCSKKTESRMKAEGVRWAKSRTFRRCSQSFRSFGFGQPLFALIGVYSRSLFQKHTRGNKRRGRSLADGSAGGRFWGWGLMKLAVLGHGGRSVAGGQFQGFFRASFDAISAGDAEQPVDRPFLGRAGNRKGARGAFFGADRAKDTGVGIEHQLASGSGDDAAGFGGIAAGGRAFERPLQGQAGHCEVCHINVQCS